ARVRARREQGRRSGDLAGEVSGLGRRDHAVAGLEEGLEGGEMVVLRPAMDLFEGYRLESDLFHACGTLGGRLWRGRRLAEHGRAESREQRGERKPCKD